MADPYSGEGSGTEVSPYLITTFSQLCEMMTCHNRLFSWWKLATNIDASASTSLDAGAGWNPVGTLSNPFYGRFDGNGKIIIGLFINRPSTLYIGLFGYIAQGEDKVKNVGLISVDITAFAYVGSICGWNVGTITNCYCTGTLVATGKKTGTGPGTKAGGLCGLNMGKINHSYSMVDVGATAVNSGEVGGFCGNNAGLIDHCFSTGTVEAYSNVGGFCGANEGTIPPYIAIITDCYCTGAVTGTSYVGGFCGNNYNVTVPTYMPCVSNCYSTGVVIGSTAVGGFCGRSAVGGIISSCYYDFQTSGKTDDNGGSLHKTTAQMYTASTFVDWDFTDIWTTSGDTTYPTFIVSAIPVPPSYPLLVSSFSPLDGAANIGKNDNLVITFNKNVFADTGNIVIKKTSDNSTVETIPVGDAKVTIVGQQVTINPATTLASSTGYYIQIDATCFKDSLDNYYAGISDTTTWNFTTGTSTPEPPVPPAPYTGSGSGTWDDPYIITTYAELCEMQTCINRLSSHWKLMADVDASASSGSKWVPLGYATYNPDTGIFTLNPFTGSFNGNFYTISNLYINTNYPQVGFFSNIDSQMGCYNLILNSPNITGTVWSYYNWSAEKYINGDVGSLVGALDNGTIECCSVINPTFNIDSASYMVLGGFCGENHGTINQCCVIGTSLTVNSGLEIRTGGFIGFCYVGVIKDCYCTGNIIATVGQGIVGGFAGVTGSRTHHHSDADNSMFQNCYAAVTMTNGNAGFCGQQNGGTVTFASCYYDTTLSGKTDTGKGEPRTTTQMKQVITFLGWDFVYVWSIETGISYPTLTNVCTVVITAPAYKNNTTTFSSTATFNTSVSGFTKNDIIVTNGTVSNFVRVNGEIYTFNVTPTGTGDITITIPANVAINAFGQGNTSATVIIPYDAVAPTVSSFSPTDNATGVSRTANLVINFSENVYVGTGNIVIKKTSDNSVVETIPVGDSKVTISGSQVTINPAGTLAYITEYYVQIATTCFRDFYYNYYEGISDTTSWSFTTVSETDPPIPNPSTWAIYPAYGGGKFTMTATTATDEHPPVYYSFEWLGGGGGTSSGWITNPYYECAATGDGAWKFRTKDSLGNIGLYSPSYHTLYGLIP